MKKLLLILGVLVAIPCARIIGQQLPPITLKMGESILIQTTNTPSPDPCVVCGGVKSIIVDPVTLIMQVTYMDGTIYMSPSLAPKVTIGTTTTLPYTSPATVTDSDPSANLTLNFGIPQGQPGGGTGGGGSDNAVNKVFNVVSYGAKGDGVTDDSQAFQNCFNAAMDAKGKVLIPPPPVRYRVNKTIDCSRDQFWLYVDMQARRGQGIVYMGPSGSPLIRINGQKGGWWRGLEAKIGDDSQQGRAIENSAVIRIIAENNGASSAAGFSFYDCTLELNKGRNNKGVHIGTAGNNADISHILFSNMTIWGGGGTTSSETIEGQNGYQIDDSNTCQLTWIGGGANHVNHVFHLNQGTGFYVFAMGGSRNHTDFWLNWPSTWTIDGNRWESGKQHIVSNGGGFPVIIETNSLVSDYHPDNGRLYDFQRAGSYTLDAIKFENNAGGTNRPLDQRCIYLGSGGGLGFLSVRGGAWHVSSSDLITVETANKWTLDSKGVGKFNGQDVSSFFPTR